MVLDNILSKKIEDFKQFIANMIPIAGNQTPSADTTNGSSGTNIDYAKSDHTHPKSNLYAETNHTHSQYLTTHQDISGKLNISQTGYEGKNVVVDNTTGNITFEDKPTIPQASTSSPLADMTGGAIGSDSKYAKADHQHQLSSAYATASHSHGISDLPTSTLSNGDTTHVPTCDTVYDALGDKADSSDFDTITATITYTNNTTETVELYIVSAGN